MYRARKREEVAGGKFPQARVALIYRQWKLGYTDRINGTEQRQTNARKVETASAQCSTPKGAQLEILLLNFLIQIIIFFFFQICWACSYCAGTFVTSNSTNDCTECVVKVQIVARVVPPEQWGFGWVWTSKGGGVWKFKNPHLLSSVSSNRRQSKTSHSKT